MSRAWRWAVAVGLAGVVWAAEEPWKDKDPAQWSEEDAKVIITDSPWAKSVLPEIARSGNNGGRGGGRGGGGGIGIGGIGIGLPGVGGMGRRGGGGYPQQQGGSRPDQDAPTPTLTVRWESAAPVQQAELKAHTTGSPEIDEGHYAIAVYGLPGQMANGDSKSMAAELKKQASIKREGKKDLKPTSVEVLRGEDGPVILYLFARSAEITKGDRRVEFDAQIERLKFEQAFYTEDMVMRGRLEL
ncbi:MAG TPA: hypothetical protein VGN17_13360 [Bryobacteraceae bacterium]|jgi:hypothetical protein